MDRETQEALAKLDGYYKHPCWSPINVPNYSNPGEMLGLLERWIDNEPEFTDRIITIKLSLHNVDIELKQVGVTPDQPHGKIGKSAPTFIEAAATALKKAGER